MLSALGPKGLHGFKMRILDQEKLVLIWSQKLPSLLDANTPCLITLDDWVSLSQLMDPHCVLGDYEAKQTNKHLIQVQTNLHIGV